jgi:hypothetical protein
VILDQQIPLLLSIEKVVPVLSVVCHVGSVRWAPCLWWIPVRQVTKIIGAVPADIVSTFIPTVNSQRSPPDISVRLQYSDCATFCEFASRYCSGMSAHRARRSSHCHLCLCHTCQKCQRWGLRLGSCHAYQVFLPSFLTEPQGEGEGADSGSDSGTFPS